MNKDWTFVDYRAEELVTQAEMEATQVSNTDGSPQSPSATSAPSRILVNQGYLKVCFQSVVICVLFQSVMLSYTWSCKC